MEISQVSLGLLFVLAVATGAGMGALWSLIRFLRSLCGATDEAQAGAHIIRLLRYILLTIADVLFGVLCGVMLILLLYYANDGQPRLLAVLGCGCGFFVWYHTLGKLIGKLTDTLSRALHTVLRWLFSPLRRLIGRVVQVARTRYKALCAQKQAEQQDETADDANITDNDCRDG